MLKFILLTSVSGKTTCFTKEIILGVTSSSKFELLVLVLLFCVPFLHELRDAVVKRKTLRRD